MTSRSFGALNHESDLDRTARILCLAFAVESADASKEWLRAAGLEHVRVLREGDVPAACLLRIPMGQYFGGRSVLMVGIAGVAVAPEARGRGLARDLMSREMRAIAGEGVALSCLYASTQSLYRQVGYEQAGHRFQTRMPWSVVAGLGEFAPVRALTEDDQPAIAACYARFAREYPGMLDRGAYCWRRVRHVRGDMYQGFGIDDGAGGLEGYLFLHQRRRADTGRQDIVLSDLVFLTPRAGRGLLRLLADFTTMAEELVFFGGPLHPILTLCPQQRYAVERKDYWMLRITDLKSALESRGYPAGVHTAFELDLADEIVPENAGAWRVEVAEGSARAEKLSRAPGGAMTADIGGLAAVYSGLYTPRQARMLGLVSGPDAALDAAGAAFAGTTPWMTDQF